MEQKPETAVTNTAATNTAVTSTATTAATTATPTPAATPTPTLTRTKAAAAATLGMTAAANRAAAPESTYLTELAELAAKYESELIDVEVGRPFLVCNENSDIVLSEITTAYNTTDTDGVFTVEPYRNESGDLLTFSKVGSYTIKAFRGVKTGDVFYSLPESVKTYSNGGCKNC